MGDRQRAVGGRQWSVGSRQWAVGNRRSTVGGRWRAVGGPLWAEGGKQDPGGNGQGESKIQNLKSKIPSSPSLQSLVITAHSNQKGIGRQWKRPSAQCPLPTAYCPLPAPDRLLPTARSLLPTSDCLVLTAYEVSKVRWVHVASAGSHEFFRLSLSFDSPAGAQRRAV
jgi:hypothetical protein